MQSLEEVSRRLKNTKKKPSFFFADSLLNRENEKREEILLIAIVDSENAEHFFKYNVIYLFEATGTFR